MIFNPAYPQNATQLYEQEWVAMKFYPGIHTDIYTELYVVFIIFMSLNQFKNVTIFLNTEEG